MKLGLKKKKKKIRNSWKVKSQTAKSAHKRKRLRNSAVKKPNPSAALVDRKTPKRNSIFYSFYCDHFRSVVFFLLDLTDSSVSTYLKCKYLAQFHVSIGSYEVFNKT